MQRKRIPIGYEDIREIMDQDMYFVDKSMLVRDLLQNGAKVTLLTRPRRFGKTLNLSMLRRFFEDERDEKGEKVENGYIFQNLAVSACREICLKHQQQYPVINLTLKSGRQPNFEMAYESLVDKLINEYQRHSYIQKGDMPQRDRERFERILLGRAGAMEYAEALGFLSRCLANFHGKNVIILIDEYDVPLENAYFRGFYDQMIDFMRTLFESALKTNESLAFGVVTGCLRFSILSPQYSEYFGFTEAEVKTLLQEYQRLDVYEEIRHWYDGYHFGGREIYNPWSILNYVKAAEQDEKSFPRPYWSNTSSNSVVRELIEQADDSARSEVELLMEGGTIEKPIHEEVTYGDIYDSADNLWNFLCFTGYLTVQSQRMEGEDIYLGLAIPNTEIRSVYRNSILSWFDQKVKKLDKTPLIRAFETGDYQAAEEFLSNQLLNTISYYDYAENYYHGFLTGILAGIEGYQLLSNRESGAGRPDLVLKSKAVRKGRAIILELKTAKSVHDMEEQCCKALEQIERQKYAREYLAEGYPEIKKYGICFYRKDCMVRAE